MRYVNSDLWDIWRTRDHTGPFAPRGDVTIEPGWWLTNSQRMNAGPVLYPGKWPVEIPPPYGGAWKWGRIRSYQNADNDQYELAVPHVVSIDINRSLEQDVATCTIVLANTEMRTNLDPGEDPEELGDKGYYTAYRGGVRWARDPTNKRKGSGPGENMAFLRWAHERNPWYQRLVPNALLRTYQGYGGAGKTREDAVADGDIVLTGVWIVDRIRENARRGTITVECRDIGALLLKHVMYPPLMQVRYYPLRFARWKWEDYKVRVKVRDQLYRVRQRCTYRDSSEDRWYPDRIVAGRGANIHGHFPADAIDGSQTTYWLSVGNSGPNKVFAYNWIEFDTYNQFVDAIDLTTIGSGYQVFVSVMENGSWIGSRTIPYDHTPLIGNQPHVVDTGADIPYIHQFGLGPPGNNDHRSRGIIPLPRRYRAQRIRLTFHNLVWFQWEPWNYRAALGDFAPLISHVQAVYEDQTRSRRVDGNYKDYCLDEASEILTRRGWLRWDEVDVGDETLGVDPDTNTPVWQTVEHVYRRHRERDMVAMKGASFDALTTPDHRWLTRHGDNKWRWTTSDAITATDRIPLTVPAGQAPTEAKYDDAFVEMVAWFWTEGWWRKPSGSALAQSRRANPAHCDAIERCLTEHLGPPGVMARGRYQEGRGAEWRIGEQRPNGVVTYILSTGVTKALRQIVDDDKVPNAEFLCALTQQQLDRFIDVSMMADGWDRKGRHYGFAQRVKRRSDAFQFACALAGRPTITHARTVDGKTMWATTMLETDYAAPIRSASRAGRATVTRVPYEGIVWCPTVQHGNFIARRNGSVYVTGNSDIVKILLLWSGWWLAPAADENGWRRTTGLPQVYGNIESTGAYAEEQLPAEMFDKVTPMESITALKNIVGYHFFIDQEGGAHFSSPNWWTMGNFTEVGQPTAFIPEIDEEIQLTDYEVTSDADAIRSEIIIATEEPTAGFRSTKATRYRMEHTRDMGHGIANPGMWVNGSFMDLEEQQRMAELVAMHVMFSMRTGQVTCPANPLLDIDDQVRLWERVTGDTFIHYVRGISTHQDLVQGSYTMTLTTNWLGDRDNWAIRRGTDHPGTYRRYVVPDDHETWARVKLRCEGRYFPEKFHISHLQALNAEALAATGGLLVKGMELEV